MQVYRGPRVFCAAVSMVALAVATHFATRFAVGRFLRRPASVSSAGLTHPAFPLEITSDPVVLRVVVPEEGRSAALTLRNIQATPLTIDRVTTSCPCIRLEPLPTRIDPDEAKTLAVIFHAASDERDLEDGLSVRITGYSTDGMVAFQTLARIDVGSE